MSRTYDKKDFYEECTCRKCEDWFGHCIMVNNAYRTNDKSVRLDPKKDWVISQFYGKRNCQLDNQLKKLCIDHLLDVLYLTPETIDLSDILDADKTLLAV